MSHVRNCSPRRNPAPIQEGFQQEMTRTERDIFFLPIEPPLEEEHEDRMKTKLTVKQINSVRYHMWCSVRETV
jgi:hypothetical protein